MDNIVEQNNQEKVFFKIIIPNYNNMPYIKKCLDSILEQTFQDFKIIIVDDMSTDLSDKFCEMYTRKYPDKIVFQRLKNKGYAGAARNIGLDYPINCKYILFVDSDDWLYNSNVLYQIYKKIINSPKNIKLIKLAMFTYYGENNSKNYVKKFNDNLTLEEAFLNGCGPGRTCISQELSCCKFKENRQIANDIIWSMRCLDKIDDTNLLNVSFPWAIYNKVSITSGTNLIKKDKTSKSYISQMQLLLNDLKHEVFNTPIIKAIQKKLISQYSNQFNDANTNIINNHYGFNNIEYEYKKTTNKNNNIHVLVINFSDTSSFTRSLINDLIVQIDDFDLTIIDNNSNDLKTNIKYYNLLYKNWNLTNRALHIIGLNSTLSLNMIWNTFYETTTNQWLCFLNNDVSIPENFISDNNKIIKTVNTAGIINHTTNNPKYKTNTEKILYKIYNKKSNKFVHRQGWDFTINRNLYVKIPSEFTTYVGDCIQFNSVYTNNKDVIFVYSSPIIHYKSISQKQNIEYFKRLLKEERQIFSLPKYLNYGNNNIYDFDKDFSIAEPTNIQLLKQNVYGTDKKIIVSMTSWKPRIHNIPSVLKTILSQTFKPHKIVINLALEEFKTLDEIPKDVLYFININKIEINWVDKNTKVYKKIIPTLLKYKNDLILSIDDDFLYPNTMIEDFYNMYKQYPNSPISGNNIIKFNLNCHCGCASLVQYKFYNLYLNDYLTYYNNCKSSDILYTYIANINGYQYIRTTNEYFHNMKKILNKDDISYSNCYNNLIEETYKWLKNNYE